MNIYYDNFFFIIFNIYRILYKSLIFLKFIEFASMLILSKGTIFYLTITLDFIYLGIISISQFLLHVIVIFSYEADLERISLFREIL